MIGLYINQLFPTVMNDSLAVNGSPAYLQCAVQPKTIQEWN